MTITRWINAHGSYTKSKEALTKRTEEEISSYYGINEIWVTISGKVYNVKPFLEYHPGGKEVILKFAGRDATHAYMNAHQWVDAHALLENLQVGVLQK